VCVCGCWERKSNNLARNSCCPLPLSIIFLLDRSARMANSAWIAGWRCALDLRPAWR
jgi:hypothetical protein